MYICSNTIFHKKLTIGDRGRHPGPGRKMRKSGTRDRDSKLKNSGTQLWENVPGTKEFRDSVPGTEEFPVHGSGPVPTPDWRA